MHTFGKIIGALVLCCFVPLLSPFVLYLLIRGEE